MMPGAAVLAINQVQLWNECNKMVIFGALVVCVFMSPDFFMFRTGFHVRYMSLLYRVPFALRTVILWT